MKAFRFQSKSGRGTLFGRMIGLLAVAAVLLLLRLAADPQSHERLHHDAGREVHHCVVSDFVAGQGFYLPPAISARPITTVFESFTFEHPGRLREPLDYALLPSCGPPFDGRHT